MEGQKERSVAWFKLADLIARGEREKALSVFRLLAHSLPDKAYTLQVEGDILWYMDDRAAAEKYRQAAVIYQKDKRFVDAIAIQEHLLTQRPEGYEPLVALLVLYALTDWPDRFTARFDQLLAKFKQRALDVPQFEKALRDIAHTMTDGADGAKKDWLCAWFYEVTPLLPPEVVTQVSSLF